MENKAVLETKKKPYVSPAMQTVDLSAGSTLLAGSGGHANACAHGSHAWFCDDDDIDEL